MATNTSSITGGAIDTASIVQQLMQVEKQPLTKLQRKEAAYQAKITALGTLLGSVSSLKGAASALKDSALLGYKATVSDSSFLTASASGAASAGSHTIQVKTLASTQSVYSAAFAAESDPVADLSVVASQKLKLQVGSTVKEIIIDSSSNTLSGIRDAINASNAGVRASIVNDGTGNRLVLNTITTGTANRMVLSIAEDGANYTGSGGDVDNAGLSRLAFDPTYNPDGTMSGGVANMSQSQAALNAVFRVNGLEITKSSNTVSDVLTGVTLTLTKADNYASSATLKVDKDNSSLKARMNAFVAAYNALNAQIKQLRGTKDAKGTLSGESVLLGIGNSIRGTTTATFADNQLANLGITSDKNGVLSVDATKLDAVLAADSSTVVAALNAMGASLDSTLKTYVDNILPGRQSGLQATVKNIQKQQEAMSSRLVQIEARLKKQYTVLDQALQQLQGQSDYVTKQLSQINKVFGGSSS